MIKTNKNKETALFYLSAEKYCDLLEEEGGLALLEQVSQDPRPIEEVSLLATQILNFIKHRKLLGPSDNQINGDVNGLNDEAMDG